ncbi:MAG TPA: GntR family transcriptional regulator [Bordetella sp.]|nr:GntR family transcriptional regulator [Bordetella sp.]
MKKSSVYVSQPKYVQLAQTLLNEIESGVFKIGDQLPTEFDLCGQFGVSRFTAREALKRLVELGIVSRQARVGTIVIAGTPQRNYRQQLGSVGDLYQYATDTSLRIDRSNKETLDAASARFLRSSPGETWLHVHGRRYVASNPLPIAYTEIWIAPPFRALQGLKGDLHQAVHSLIEEQFGEEVFTVEQEIHAVTLRAATARELSTKPGTAGLKITRYYLNQRGELIECAVSTHAAEHFTYSSVFKRGWN